MYFKLSSNEITTIHPRTTSVKVYFTTGVAQICPNHQDLIGKIENNLVDVIETNTEGQNQTFRYFVQEGSFLVSNAKKYRVSTPEGNDTVIFVVTTRYIEINSNLTKAKVLQQIAIKEAELQNLNQAPGIIMTPNLMAGIRSVSSEIDFLKKLLNAFQSLEATN